ncbi:MAG TPA: LuxR C-terminal-related transcriptional regulator [Solirubrobacteraceae bacterium]|nr:LuxR C-terminal-related transcriptional regulator [Solirubrobacteraceae bacterium]
MRCAFWVSFLLLNRGDFARTGGWVARGQRILDEGGEDSVEYGYLLIPPSRIHVLKGAWAEAHAMAAEAAEIGERFGDLDLVTISRLILGRTLLRRGMTADALVLLDETMVAVVADEVSPTFAGLMYCGTIAVCQEIFDLGRAREWTTALTQWCRAQPDLVPYSGECLVHRAEILQLHGAWRDAVEAGEAARDRFLRRAERSDIGGAFYQLAELHRLMGDYAAAEEAYRQANRWGREPQPGLALLRLSQGQTDAAQAAIRRAVDEAANPTKRARLLPAHVEIMLAVGDVPAARAAADELAQIAEAFGAPMLLALSTQAQGAVLLAEGDATGALAALRQAWVSWQTLETPYEGARARVLIAQACSALGDTDTAAMELDAARAIFHELGAAADLARVQAPSSAERTAGGLTGRELQVLRLVAAGKTNRTIAEELFLSEKTVARHISNIFAKLRLSTRAAATAYAYEHDLV